MLTNPQSTARGLPICTRERQLGRWGGRKALDMGRVALLALLEWKRFGWRGRSAEGEGGVG